MSEIRDRILASPELQAARAARDLDALTAGLNAQGVTAIQSRFVNMRTIVAELSDADNIIKALSAAAPSSPALGEMMNFLRSDTGMDIGHPNAQARVDALLTATAITSAQGAAIKNMALQPIIVTRDQVGITMYNPDGTEKTA
jgi:hypothetical protein